MGESNRFGGHGKHAKPINLALYALFAIRMVPVAQVSEKDCDDHRNLRYAGKERRPRKAVLLFPVERAPSGQLFLEDHKWA